MTDDAQNVPKYYITNKFLAIVEEQIKADPRYYFWTHKRWKHRR
ncbi:LpxL/LpxP family acyltransferase [Flavobacterium agricola]|nr:hypothetical protein [Flavobacterium agricola]